MSSDHTIVHLAKDFYDKFDPFDDPELSNIIKQHALAATATAFIPVPGVDVAAIVANVWTMYVRINQEVGVSFSENVLKSIASGVIANVSSVIPTAVIAAGAGSLLKLFPGLGTAGGIAIAAVSNVAILYVAGVVYLKSLEVLIHSNKPLTEKNIRMATEQTSKDKDFVKNAYEEGKKVAKNQ